MPAARSLFEPEPAPWTPPAHGYIRVAVERGIERGWAPGDADGLTYRADEPMEVGERVIVPLGRGDRLTPGLVIARGGPELLGAVRPELAKPAARQPTPPMPRALVELGVWLSNYYVCPLGMTFAAMAPAAVKRGVGARAVRLLDRADAPGPETDGPPLTPAARAAWASLVALPAEAFPAAERTLARAAGAPSVAPIRRLVRAGLLREVERRTIRARAPDSGIDGSIGGVGDEPTVGAARPELTAAQRAAVDGITDALGAFGVHVLFGVTGSGKTEVYLGVVERALAAGRSAIVLAPEIALTPQTVARFVGRFGPEAVAVLHSGLTEAQRHAAWDRAARGGARVVVGARSAVFAPVRDLGVVVVDEEHDASYKQDRAPRYHARDVAIKRAQIEGALAVLGSATPALETWARATGARKTGGDRPWPMWRLPARVRGVLPRVLVVDLREERRRALDAGLRADALIGPTLGAALSGALAEGGQAILMLNRRGYAAMICCADRRCGWRLGCEHCDVGLVWHRSGELPRGGVVRCHHCQAEQRLPARCPLCGGRVLPLRGGTQRLETELTERFGLEPGAALRRLDADTMRTGADYFEALSGFARGEARVLLGTQMIAKGLDFPGVRLVGVIDADTALGIPDFRALERTFQLISQVAGRAGRSERGGRVVVQTWSPDCAAIRAAAEHDYERFAADELATREACGLPPARRMAMVVSRDVEAAEAERAARALADVLREAAGPTVELHGPVPCAIARIADHYRFGIELLAPRAGEIQRALARARAAGLLKSDAHTAVDVDPVSTS